MPELADDIDFTPSKALYRLAEKVTASRIVHAKGESCDS